MAKRPASARTAVPDPRPKNRLLRALPDADFQRLVPDLKTIRTRTRYVFYKLGETLEHVYFPNGGVASVTAALSDGTMVETAVIGNEGMVGIEAFFGEDAVAAGNSFIQVPDTDAEELSVFAFRRELARKGALSDLMGRYAQTTIAQLMQSTACNALHEVQERCPRWLLMTHDRVGQNGFDLSHEFLAIMLGVRRQRVTAVARTLQAAGLITYEHEHVTILNRPGLEAASCECYALIRGQFDALRLPGSPAAPAQASQ